jgi:hypothetical protein
MFEVLQSILWVLPEQIEPIGVKLLFGCVPTIAFATKGVPRVQTKESRHDRLGV